MPFAQCIWIYTIQVFAVDALRQNSKPDIHPPVTHVSNIRLFAYEKTGKLVSNSYTLTQISLPYYTSCRLCSYLTFKNRLTSVLLPAITRA